MLSNFRTIGLYRVPVPVSRILGDPALSFKVCEDKSKSLAVAVAPFEIVQEGPLEISFAINTILDGFLNLFQVAVQEIDPGWVVYPAVQLYPVGASHTVFCYHDGQLVSFVEIPGSPVDTFRGNSPAHRR